jgi:glucose/arabinose dehydrogenase
MTRRNLVFAALLAIGSQKGWSQPLQLINAFPALSFTQPIFLTHSGDGTNRVFVVQQTGQIRVFPNDSLVASSAIFLNITSLISASSGEEGLLGLAFHPQYAANGYFYVNYTAPNPLRTVISRFKVSTSDPNVADPASEFKILEFNQPFTNHNGGMLAFGPDGYLYIGAGDGGSGGDPNNNGQNLSVLLGKILRIDVNGTGPGMNYRIPADNPFAGNGSGYREEIWAYGLRNPWRFSFDYSTGRLWAGDVGQDSREEVDIIEKGGNYGWRIMEGFACYNPSSGCNQAGLTLPIKDYDHTVGKSITGGYIYHGSRRQDLQGAYIYGDYVAGKIWMLRYSGGTVTADSLLLSTGKNLSSFGTDQQNELYVLSYSGSVQTAVYRFNSSVSTAIGGISSDVPNALSLQQNYPNPFNPSTVIRFGLPVRSNITIRLLNVLGQVVRVLVDTELSAGFHEIMLNADGMSSGLYFCRLESRPVDGGANVARTIRLVLAK